MATKNEVVEAGKGDVKCRSQWIYLAIDLGT